MLNNPGLSNKYPNRPLIVWSTHDLEGMVRSLSRLSLLNTPKENKRLSEAKAELKARRKGN